MGVRERYNTHGNHSDRHFFIIRLYQSTWIFHNKGWRLNFSSSSRVICLCPPPSLFWLFFFKSWKTTDNCFSFFYLIFKWVVPEVNEFETSFRSRAKISKGHSRTLFETLFLLFYFSIFYFPVAFWKKKQNRKQKIGVLHFNEPDGAADTYVRDGNNFRVCW